MDRPRKRMDLSSLAHFPCADSVVGELRDLNERVWAGETGTS